MQSTQNTDVESLRREITYLRLIIRLIISGIEAGEFRRDEKEVQADCSAFLAHF